MYVGLAGAYRKTLLVSHKDHGCLAVALAQNKQALGRGLGGLGGGLLGAGTGT